MRGSFKRRSGRGGTVVMCLVVGGALVVASPFGAAATAVAPKGEVNLVANGSFEAGKNGIPEKWQRPDGLASFWVKDSKRPGMCLKIDDDVYKQEYLDRQNEMEKNPVPPPKPKTPTKGPKYDTIAGVDGVSFYSEWIAVTPGQYYRLDVDFRTEGEKKTPKVFVKGYFLDSKRPEPYQRRVKYKKFLNCPGDETWKTFSMTFCPTTRDTDVKWMRVMLFAYWPPGIYYFDNVKLVPVPPPPDAPKKTGAGTGAKKPADPAKTGATTPDSTKEPEKPR
jgi:hypothetical protein